MTPNIKIEIAPNNKVEVTVKVGGRSRVNANAPSYGPESSLTSSVTSKVSPLHLSLYQSLFSRYHRHHLIHHLGLNPSDPEGIQAFLEASDENWPPCPFDEDWDRQKIANQIMDYENACKKADVRCCSGFMDASAKSMLYTARALLCKPSKKSWVKALGYFCGVVGEGNPRTEMGEMGVWYG